MKRLTALFKVYKKVIVEFNDTSKTVEDAFSKAYDEIEEGETTNVFLEDSEVSEYNSNEEPEHIEDR